LGNIIYVITLAASFICVILVGFLPKVGYTFTLSRIICFLPFFLLGAAQRHFIGFRDFFVLIKKYSIILIALTILIAFAFTVLINVNSFNPEWTYFAKCYKLTKCPFEMRLWLMITAVCAIYLLISLIPNRKTKLSVLGQRTLYVYLLHGFIVKMFFFCKIYKLPVPSMIYVFVATVLIIIFLSSDNVKFIYDKLFFC